MIKNKTTQTIRHVHQCPGCWSVSNRNPLVDGECYCGEALTNIDLRRAHGDIESQIEAGAKALYEQDERRYVEWGAFPRDGWLVKHYREQARIVLEAATAHSTTTERR